MLSDFFNNRSILNIHEIFLSILIKSAFLEFNEIFFIIFESCKFLYHLINQFSNSSFGIRVTFFEIILFKFSKVICDSFKFVCKLFNFLSSKIDGIRNFALIHICFDIIYRFSAFVSFCKNDNKVFLLSIVLLMNLL
jgi:hypothetical protein